MKSTSYSHLHMKTPVRIHGLTLYLVSICAIAAAYFLTAELILSIPVLSGQASPVWPPAGIAMGALLLLGRRMWPGIMIAALVLDYTHSGNLAESLVSGLSSSLQAIAGVSLLRWAGVRLTLERLRDVIGLLSLGGLVATLVSSTLSVGFLSLIGRIPIQAFPRLWGTFWLGDSIGVLILTPLILLAARRQRFVHFSAKALAERGLWLLLLVSLSYSIFHSQLSPALMQYPIEYGPYLLLIWAALRFEPLLAVLGSAVVSAIAIWGALEEGGPFVAQAVGAGYFSPTAPFLPLQAFMGVTAVTTLMLATAVGQQRATQQLLRQSESSLCNAQRIARIGHWDFQPSTGEWYWSTELYRLLGFDPQTLRSDRPSKAKLLQMVHPDDRDRVQRLLEDALFSGKPYVANYRLQLAKGQNRHVVEQVDVSADRITGTIQDITTQRQAEQALRESEEKFSKAFGFSPDAITISTLNDGKIIDVNDSFLRLSGYQRHEVLCKTVMELNLWADLSDRQWLIEQIRQQRPVRNQEFEFYDCSGRSVYALVSAELIPLKGERYLLLVARDITEKKRADERLRLANERDRLLAEIALHIRQTLDLQDMLDATVGEVRRLLQAGRVFICRFDDRNKGSVVAESVMPDYSSLMGEQIDEAVHAEICNVFDQTPVVSIDNMAHLDDFPCLSFLQECVQRYQVKAALGVPIMVNDKLYGILVAHHCDTPRPWQPFEKELLERLATQVAIAIQQGQLYTQVQQLNAGLEHQVKERTLQLEQKMAELQEMNQLRDMFLHAVSHDLRTTVMGNLMLLRNLQQQPQDPVYLNRSLLDRMIQAGDCQLDKLNSLQEAYLLKTQGLTIEPTSTHLHALVDGAIAHLTPLIEKNRANISVASDASLPTVWADGLHIQRVLQHILENAIIHNPPGVDVEVVLEAADDHWVSCTIIDNGKGMTQELCDRLFQLSISSPGCPHLTGISLGLYLCRQMILAHGGKITASSVLGEGTTISFSLPHVPAVE